MSRVAGGRGAVGAKRTFIVWLGVLLGAGLTALGVSDYIAVRREFLLLLRDQATALQQTIATAARLNRAAASTAERDLGERLLENARLLERLDRANPLTERILEETVRRDGRYHVTVYDAEGRPVLLTGPAASRYGGAQVVDMLFAGDDDEVVTPVHAARFGGEPRMAAAVRRSRGGAIVLNVDASAITSLQEANSLEALLTESMATTSGLTYVVIESPDGRIARGDVTLADAVTAAAGPAASAERQTPGVVEVAAPLQLAPGRESRLRIGVRTDGLRGAERRTVIRLGVALSLTLIFVVAAFMFVSMRREYGTLSDEHRRAVAALEQKDRLSAMGELAAGVAHDVRNPLNAIAMTLQRLRHEFLPGPGTSLTAAEHAEAAELLCIAGREAGRVNDTVQRFLEFARPPALVRQPTPLGPFVAGVVADLGPLASARDVALSADTARAATADIDPGQLRTALENLVRNAIDATPPGGTIQVRAASSHRGHAIEVKDTGAGIAPEVLPRIFDLYFTTKAAGTGIGLPVAQQVITSHGGAIEVSSTPGAGAVMIIRLPRT